MKVWEAATGNLSLVLSVSVIVVHVFIISIRKKQKQVQEIVVLCEDVHVLGFKWDLKVIYQGCQKFLK